MKSFNSVPFFLLFEQIIRADNRDLKLDQWSAKGVEWERARHSFNGRTYGYALELFTASRTGKDAWTLLIAKEQWWGGRHDDVVKIQQWAKPVRGKRISILGWFAERKKQLGQ